MSANFFEVGYDEIEEFEAKTKILMEEETYGARVKRGIHETHGEIFIVYTPIGNPLILPLASLPAES